MWRRRRTYTLRILLLVFFLWDSLHCISLHLRHTAALRAPPPPRNAKRVYIAAQHFNDARLLHDHWNAALIALVQELGVGNVFVSIYESGSWDGSKELLGELDAELERLYVKRAVTLSELSRADEIAQQQQPGEQGGGWIETPNGETRKRRIPFLATVRNHVFEPLERLTAEGDTTFDTVLFLNDVVFTPEDVLKLLDTNGGDYAAACSLDFSKPPYLYDTFALRDSSGHEAVMQTWPYFRSYISRYAAERLLPVPVASCWNGMIAMPMQPFLGNSPLRFRGISDTLATFHVEASECCLIHADNPLSATKGIFLNPNVKVGYNGSSYDAVHSPDAVMSPLHMYRSIWQNRLLRWFTSPLFKEHIVCSRVRKWMKGTKEQERGGFCLINEMQILFESGWKHM
ncbi:hypothetical protein BDW02DRAFT_550958 [Decorospora gaudefroyi]|uniref:Polysaccharide export protein n=1 Tax=Decorospora gaudefroyi TaxID=184978 RepID=A0A6A5KL22_9PLEO|nr:hypothetical protein BDW02DRAFT_550958 [Decorospora gaudefroyi]